MVTHCNNVFRKRAEILEPISALSNVHQSWFEELQMSECDEAFKKIEASIVQDVLLPHPAIARVQSQIVMEEVKADGPLPL